jgi:CheY-like chemotaxis protein
MSSCSLASLSFALKHLYELRVLQSSPLISMVSNASRSNAPAALRHTLIKAIESLKPDEDTPPQSLAWRAYEILHYRYVQQCSQLEVADQLGLSVRHLKREQHRAMELLAQHLCEHFGFHIQILAGTEGRPLTPDEDEETLTSSLCLAQEPVGGKTADLSALLPGVLELLQSMASRYEIDISSADTGSLPPLAVDPVVLRQMLLSVLCVAVRRARGHQLTITAQALPSAVEVSVHGASSWPSSGLTAEDEANLDVARQLAHRAGATLTLPATSAEDTITIQLPTVQRVPVLVIDDHLDALQLFQRYAAGTRYAITGVQSLERAMAAAKETSPRIIVLDVMLPETDGWEILGRLKHHPQTSGIPVVACTILAQEELAFSLGVSAFLRKPVSRRDFLATLDHLVAAPSV